MMNRDNKDLNNEIVNEDVLDALRNEMQDLQIPEELAPYNMMKKLDGLTYSSNVTSMKDYKAVKKNKVNKASNDKKRKKKIVVITSVLSAVAMVAVTLTATLAYYGVLSPKKDEGGRKVISDAGILVEAPNGFNNISSYDELKGYFERQERYDRFNDVLDSIFSYGEISSDGMIGDMENSVDMIPETTPTDKDNYGMITNKPSDGMGAAGDYSDTNVRTEGVGEADIVKTDGKYIYALTDDEIKIIKADGEDSTIVATISPLDNIEKWADDSIPRCSIKDMYLVEGKLIVVTTLYVGSYKVGYSLGDYPEGLVYNEEYYAGHYGKALTIVRTYDVKEAAKVILIGDISVDGEYASSRIKDGHMYIFTDKPINIDGEYIPYHNNEKIAESDVYVAQYSNYDKYSIISSVDLKDVTKFKDTTAVISANNSEYYVSGDNIYLYSDKYERNQQKTEILKFSYKDGNIEPVATKCFAGTIKDSFCLDEYNGYLRLVITEEGNYNKYENGLTNTLYIFDEKLEKVSEITNIAEGESIYSARFMGDIGYFVTYYQTDPLFSVDLSNPKEPKIIGALKIPGFSEYLHPWGDDKLLGIGREDSSVKLSMFDVKDPSNVTESDKYKIPNCYRTPALYNYKAVLIDYEKNIIGFATDKYNNYESPLDDGVCWTEGTFYDIYQYSEEGFELIAEVELGHKYSSLQNTRGLYIGENLYVVDCVEGVTVLDMKDYKEIAFVNFEK